MSRYWEVIAPVGIVALGVLAFIAARLAHPAGDHRADPARLQEVTPDVREATVPVAKVTGLPPWHSGLLAGQDDPMMRETLLGISAGLRERYGTADGLPPWAAPEADRYGGYGWNSGSSGSSYGLPPDLEVTLRRELHHVDDLDLGPGAGMTDTGYNSHLPSGTDSAKVDSPAPAGLPREDGAGDESEASGPPAPPALLRPVDLALARCDLFMVAMRADHERWLAGARARWAA